MCTKPSLQLPKTQTCTSEDVRHQRQPDVRQTFLFSAEMQRQSLHHHFFYYNPPGTVSFIAFCYAVLALKALHKYEKQSQSVLI